MKKNKLLVFFICSLFLVSMFGFQTPLVSAQVSYQTFQNNPLDYWEISDNVDTTYHANNTISVKYSFEEGYAYRKEINITGSVGAGTNYQVKIPVTYDSDMQTDFDDIIFVDNDEVTLLDFWRQSYIVSTSAVFWVEVKDSLETSVIIYMYYGNVETSSSSNGDNTFQEFYDKTSITGWTLSNIAVSTSGEFLRFYNPNVGNAGEAQRWDITTSADFQMMSQLKTVSLGVADQNTFIIADGSLSHRFSAEYTPYWQQQTKWFYYDGSTKEGGAWVEGTEFIFTVQIDEGDSTNGIDYRRYDTSWSLLDSKLNENFAYGSPTDADGLYLGDASGGATIDVYFRWIAFRKCIDSEPVLYSTGSEEEVSFGVSSATIDIPVEKLKDISIKTMVTLETYSNDENVKFTFNTSLGLTDNLEFNLNETHGTDFIKLELSAKHRINTYRVLAQDVLLNQIERRQVYFIINKDINYLRISLDNFTVNSKLIMYYLSGNVDYTNYAGWTTTIYDDFADLEVNGISSIVIKTSSASNEEIEVLSTREFDNFQFMRTYFNFQFYEIGSTYLLSTKTQNSSLIINIENYTIVFMLEYQYDDSHTEPNKLYSFVKIYEEGTLIYNPALGAYSTEVFDIEIETINRVMVWRTQENHLGVGYGSDNLLFENPYTPNTDDERLNIWTNDREIENFSGNITMVHYLKLTTNNNFELSVIFDENEYIFNSDFGIAQPHFSTTWFDLFPFIKPLEPIWNTITGILALVPAEDLLDSWLGLSDAIGNVLSPMFNTLASVLSPIIESIATTLAPILDNILLGFSDLFGWIADGILTWAGDVADWFINTALIGFVTAIADFVIWFINGFGVLLGIAGLATIIADIIFNFVIAIAGFLNGIVFIFAFGVGVFSFAITMITTYAPMILYYGFWLFALSTALVIATMDEKKIIDLFSLYLRILEKIFYIFYSIANMVIQFIGGIIP